MKYSVLILQLFLLISCGKAGKDGAAGTDGKNGKDGVSGGSYEQDVAAFIAKAARYEASVLDIVCNNGVSSQRGTGIKTSEGILTAWHVVNGETTCSYYSAGTFVGSDGLFTQSSGNRDQALIMSPSWTATGISLLSAPTDRTYSVDIGEQLLLLSLPFDIEVEVQYTFGMVASTYLPIPSHGWDNTFTTDIVAYHGSSGGPVFNKTGNVIGLLVGGYEDNLDLTYVLPLR